MATTGVGGDEQFVAVVRYERAGSAAGEVPFLAENCWQGRGTATELLHRLVEYAQARGFVELVMRTMGWNTRMRLLLRHRGFPAVLYVAEGMTVVRLEISQPPASAGTR